MRVDYPGLLIERHRNGSPRYRVRVEGNPKRRVHIPVGPEHPDFIAHYRAARFGEMLTNDKPKSAPRSLDWLAEVHLKHLSAMVDAGRYSPQTLKQRKSVLLRMCNYTDDDGDRLGDFDMDMPTRAFVALRDAWASKPGTADTAMKAGRAMYAWAIERGHATVNPLTGIANISPPAKGAKPWTPADLEKFRARHPAGTTAHLWLTLQAFTACRIGDVILLGRQHEVTRDGQVWLEWQPAKKGSAPMSLPMLPPLLEATRAVSVVGPTYLLTQYGRPFASTEALRNRIKDWCRQAGLAGLSSHGIRKAVAALLAESGATQHQIMAMLAHTQAKTSEIYTKGAERRLMAAEGAQALAGLSW